MRVAIIGAGLTGLSLAYELEKKGFQVTVIESAATAGGVIQSKRIGDYLCEYGPHSLEVKSEAIQAFLDELGLEAEACEAPHQSNRFILKNGKLMPLPFSPIAFIKTSLFSAKAKLRLLLEPFISKNKSTADESIADFIKRRLGQEFVDYAIDPFIKGVYAGDPAQLSIRSAFPKLYELEQAYGSLIFGGMKSRKAAKAQLKPGAVLFKKRILSFKNGMHSIITALEGKLSKPVLLNTQVSAIEKKNDQWQLSYNNKTEAFDRLVVTSPAYRLHELPWQSDLIEHIKLFNKIDYAPIACVYTAFKKEEIAGHLNGFGFLAPSLEKCNLLGSLYPSYMFPERAPNDEVLLTNFIGGVSKRSILNKTDDELINETLETLAKLFTIRGKVRFTHVVRYAKAIPQYNIGYQDIVNEISELEKQFPGLHFAGNYRTGIALGHCIQNGSDLAADYAIIK